jgi:hypothetical protein
MKFLQKPCFQESSEVVKCESFSSAQKHSKSGNGDVMTHILPRRLRDLLAREIMAVLFWDLDGILLLWTTCHAKLTRKTET